MNPSREFDLIIWGASGFTGRLVAEYLYHNYGVNQEVKWAMAGRNKEKLEQVRTEVAGNEVPLVLADSHDAASLSAMAQRTKVICTTVGPYGLYGAELVKACVEQNTHYCDLAGEVLFIRDTIDKHHEAAQANGTKIVNCCGFDSIPSDLGVYYTQKVAREKTGSPAQQIDLRVKAFVGKLSGGTYASLKDTMAKAAQDKSLYGTLINPYSLNPQGEQEGPDQRDLNTVAYDKKAKAWMYPFIMAGINTKIVRRSHALAAFPYGKDFGYSEAVMTSDGDEGQAKAMKEAMALAALMGKAPKQEKSTGDKGQNPARRMPKPGEGPNKEERDAGYYDMRLYTTLRDGNMMVTKVTGDRDPGYGSTSKMLAECGICLAKDETPQQFGVITPSIAMGDALLDRLEKNAGLTFSVVE